MDFFIRPVAPHIGRAQMSFQSAICKFIQDDQKGKILLTKPLLFLIMSITIEVAREASRGMTI
jgi:hypothetical protein